MDNLITSLKTLKWYEILMITVMIFIAANSLYDAIFSNELGGNPLWLAAINFISAIAGILCVFFVAKASISNFIFSLVNTLSYMIFLYYWKIYGTFCLELFFYLPMIIFAWINWVKHKDNYDKNLTKTKSLTQLQFALIILMLVIVTVITHGILLKFSGNVIWFDAATLSFGIVAMILSAFRYWQQYILWIIIDVVSVGMYIQKFDPVYLTKRSIYLIVAIIGLYNWLKLHKTRNLENE
ncbi:MAG: nicotinamide mononucleotide transporter [Cardiobacteriaceae bacterium]|nr:nicotinamide mononucleotide transporter [Cardiobacteriaceae bacterium]